MTGPEQDFPALLRGSRDAVRPFTAEGLAAYFALPVRLFHQSGADEPIVFHPCGWDDTAAHLLRGALFWPSSAAEQQIVRSHPRVFPTSDYCQERHQILLEPMLARAVVDGELIAEPKLYGETIRVFGRGRDLYCATDVAHDGGNPLTGAGIDNSRELGIDYGSQAARILQERYPRADRLIRLGYTAVFVLQLPETAPDHSVDRADLILVDVVDPDLTFVDRLEKERIAEDYRLNIVGLAARITLAAPDPLRCSSGAARSSISMNQVRRPGVIVKGRIGDYGDQMFCKAEPASARERTALVSTADLSVVVEEITGQFGDAVWSDLRFAEELMLEYLSSRRRTVRLAVNAFLTEWSAARALVEATPARGQRDRPKIDGA